MSFVNSEGYKRFRGWVALQKLSVESSSDKNWKYYDYGPKDAPPLVFLPAVSASAECYYKQFLSLCPRGFRLISVQPSEYNTHDQWCKGFDRFLDKIGVSKVHLFGTSVGGYSAQAYVQYRPQRVLSLILCNTFSDATHYRDNAPCVDLLGVMPEFMLKRIVLSNFPKGELEEEIANSIDFMVHQLESLSRGELASRLTLNCTPFNLKPSQWEFDKRRITIIDSLDEVAVPDKLREEVYKFYPEAKIAEIKTGGNFPYLSRPDEINMYIQVHLRRIEQLEPASQPDQVEQEETNAEPEESLVNRKKEKRDDSQ